MIRLALLALVLQAREVLPRYKGDPGARDRIYTEEKLAITMEGPPAILNLFRSLHPLLSMEKLLIRAEGTRSFAQGRVRHEYDEALLECRYDDEDHEFEYSKGMAPPSQEDKLPQLLWYLAAVGHAYTLSPQGECLSEDQDQDHNGEAMELVALGVTRMPDKAVREGETYEKEWRGARSEKGKKGVFVYTQKVKVEKIEERGGKKIATLASDLTGVHDVPPGEKDAGAEEAWTRLQGKTKLVLEVESGRVLRSEGQGKVIAYYRGPAEDGSKNEVTVTFRVEGKTSVK